MKFNIFARIKSLEEQVASFNIRLEALGWDFDARQMEFEGKVNDRISSERMMALIQAYWNDHILVQIIDDRLVARLKTKGQNNETAQ